MPKTLIEPFRIKSIEPIRMTSRAEREQLLAAARLNVFKLHAEDVLIDWLTDSGTGAMSSRQWGAIMEGDESYAGARSFYRLEAVIQKITGMKFFVPTHQGRAAEKVLFTAVCKKGDVVPNNCHFDTTRANLEYLGIEALDLVIAEGLQPSTVHPFKGNIDLARAEALLQEKGGTDSVWHDHRHQQHRWWPAGGHGQHSRLCGVAQKVWQTLHHGRVPLL
jgi:tryptophanase